MIRRLKKDVLKDLPRKLRKHVSVPLSGSEGKELQKHFVQLKQLNNFLNKVVVATQETRHLAFQRQSLISEMFRATARAKLKGVRDYVKGVLQDNADQKIILFGFHQITMNSLEELVRAVLKERFIRIDGKTPQMERQGLVDDFQSASGPRVAILSIGACNSGITLTACHYTIFCELTWTPSLMLQCEDRTHRIGQEQVCHYDYLCASESLDERVLNKIQSKFGLLDRIIDGKGNSDGFDIGENLDFERVFEEDASAPEAKRAKVSVIV
jgi:SWI/SNF-related matrix-associated actin-dependent regulator 1 of chromatin subfamily A